MGVIKNLWVRFRALPIGVQIAVGVLWVVIGITATASSPTEETAPTTTTVQSPATTEPSSATTVPTTTTAVEEADCRQDDTGLATQIGEGATVSGVELSDAQSVELDPDVAGLTTLRNLRFVVAAEVEGPGYEGAGDVGLWAVGDLEGGGGLFAVNDLARTVTSWGSAADPSSPAGVDLAAIDSSRYATDAAGCIA